MDPNLIHDLVSILGHIHVFVEHDQLVNTLDDITISGRELLRDCLRISFKNLQTADLRVINEEFYWSFVGILHNDMIGWLRAELVNDYRVYKIRLVVSTDYPVWWPAMETLS
jgi:hypothetical protein